MNLVVILFAVLAILIGSATHGESLFVYKVPGITWDKTAAAARAAVENLDGSKSAVVDISAATLSVTQDESVLGPEDVKTALQRAGFAVQEIKKIPLDEGSLKASAPVPWP